MMTYLLAMVAGLLGAVVGWFVTGAVAVWIAGLFGMSDFEGARGMFAFYGVGPIGGLLSLLLAVWLVLRIGKGPARLGTTVARLVFVLGAIIAVVAAGIGVRLLTLDTYTDTLPPTLEFEVRVPATMPLPEPSALRVELHTDKNVGQSVLAQQWQPGEDGRQIVTGIVSLDFKTSSRLLIVAFPDQPIRLFRLPLSRDPGSTQTMTSWMRPDHLDEPGAEQPRPAPADDPVEVRYRVRRAGDD